MRVAFKIDGEPQGKARPRFGNGRAYTPKKTVEYEKHVRWCYSIFCKSKRFAPDVPLSVEILACYAPPKSASKKTKQMMLSGEVRPTKKPDADNIAKIILDALNGIAYDDDKQVIHLDVNKKYAERACVYVEIKECVNDG